MTHRPLLYTAGKRRTARMVRSVLAFALLALSVPTVAAAAVKFPNPISGVTKAEDLYIMLIRANLRIVGVVSLLFFIWGGLRMITSAGNAEILKKAKDTILWSVIGMVLVLLSYTIVEFFFEVFTNTPGAASTAP